MCGRLAGGMATSILFSAFESWVICEHDKVCQIILLDQAHSKDFLNMGCLIN